MDDLFFSDVLARADRILVGVEPFPKFELLQTQASMIKQPPVRQQQPFHHRIGPSQTSSNAIAGVGLQWHPSARNHHLQHHMAARSLQPHNTGDLFKIPISLEDAELAANSLESLAYNGDGEDWDEDDIPPDIMYSPASAQSSSAADPQAQDLPRLTLTPADFDAAMGAMGAMVGSMPSMLPHGTLEAAVQAFNAAPSLMMKEEISFDSILKDIKSSSEQLGKKIEPPSLQITNETAGRNA